MDIPEEKLISAAQNGIEVRFEYHHNEARKGSDISDYVCSYVYSIPAQKLYEDLNKHRDKIYRGNKEGNKRKSLYRVYLEYKTGCLHTTYCNTRKLICKLNAVYDMAAVKLGSYALEKAIIQLKGANEKSLLMQLVANCAVWAPKEAVEEQEPDEFKHVRFKIGSGKKKGEKEMDSDGKEIIYDDNTQPNRKIKSAIKRFYGFIIASGEYHVCHIWEGTCYDRLYHTDLRNIVLLPSSIYSLSDYYEPIRDMLKCRSAELYGEMNPNGKKLPKKPAHYKEITWPEMPSNINFSQNK